MEGVSLEFGCTYVHVYFHQELLADATTVNEYNSANVEQLSVVGVSLSN